MEFKPNTKHKAVIPFTSGKVATIHIDHVLPSIYDDQKLIIYRYYGKHKQWWHEFMCTDDDMEYYLERAIKEEIIGKRVSWVNVTGDEFFGVVTGVREGSCKVVMDGDDNYVRIPEKSLKIIK